MLLGNPSVALASVNFYARALQPNEVAEMYVGGQPLSELATGSVLPQVQVNEAEQIVQEVRSSAGATEENIEIVRDQTLYNNVVSMTGVQEASLQDVDNIVLHPPDAADATVFAGTQAQGNLLSEFGKKVWEAGGRQTWATEEARRAAATWRSDNVHQFWPILQGPIFATHNLHLNISRFPHSIPAASEGFTFSFWQQQLEVNRSDDVRVYFRSGSCSSCTIATAPCHTSNPSWETASCFDEVDASCPDDCVQIMCRNLGFWVQFQLKHVKTGENVWIGDNPGVWEEDNPDQRVTDERCSYLLLGAGMTLMLSRKWIGSPALTPCLLQVSKCSSIWRSFSSSLEDVFCERRCSCQRLQDVHGRHSCL